MLCHSMIQLITPADMFLGMCYAPRPGQAGARGS